MVQMLISREDYYKAFAFWNIACEAQTQVREYEKLLNEIIKDTNFKDLLNDKIYDSTTKGSKKEFDELMSKSNLTIEWQLANNKFSKMEGKEE
jgi:hypothetical protein